MEQSRVWDNRCYPHAIENRVLESSYYSHSNLMPRLNFGCA